jgi:hypothetical protein
MTSSSITPFLHWFLVTFWDEDRKFRLQNHAMYNGQRPYRDAR